MSGRRVCSSVQSKWVSHCIVSHLLSWVKCLNGVSGRKCRKGAALRLHPAATPCQNHICVTLGLLILEYFHSPRLSGVITVERAVWILLAWFCFCCCLHMNLKSQLTQTTTKMTSSMQMIDSIWNVCKFIEWTDPLIVFTFCCGVLNT